MKKIAVFASGSGSNAENIANYLNETQSGQIVLILTNKKEALVVERAKRLGINYVVFTRDDFYHSTHIVDMLIEAKVDLVVLAGFLWLVPPTLVKAFEGRIVNIHPALLPKYGGKGMYGHFVHQAVVANHEKESGITIHFVNEHYDEGSYILQAKCDILETDSADDVAKKVHALEYYHYPRVIAELLNT